MTPMLPNAVYTIATGTTSTSAFIEVFEDRAPTSYDTNYPLQKRWLDTSTSQEYILTAFTSFNGLLQAVWTNTGISQVAFTGGAGTTGTFPVDPDINGEILLSSNAGTIVITGGTNALNFDIVGGTPAIESITGDDTLPATPTSGNINLSGNVVANGTHAVNPVFVRRGATDTEVIDVQFATAAASANIFNVGLSSYNNTQFSVSATGFVSSPRTASIIVDPVVNQGDYQTIAAAIAASTAGQTIFIRPGVYTEDITLKPNVNMSAYTCDAYGGTTTGVRIVGMCTYNGGAGAAVSLSGIHFQTNGNFCLNISGSDGQLTLTNCFINAVNATGINVAAGNAINIHIHYSLCISTATFAMITSASAANIQINFCELTGSNPGVSTFTSGALFLNNTVCLHPLQTSGSTATLIVSNCRFANVSTFSQAPITHNSTIAGCSVVNSVINSGAQPCISIGPGATLTVANMVLNSSATNVTTGTGTLRYANIVYIGTSTGNNVTTSTPLAKFN